MPIRLRTFAILQLVRVPWSNAFLSKSIFPNRRRVSRFASVLATTLFITGCALWPERAIQAKKSEHVGADTLLPKALEYADAAITNFEQVRSSAADLERGASYALYGLAVATGWNLAGNHSRQPVKTFALSAASILGFREVVKPDEQRRILKIGLDSIQCTLRVNDQYDLTAERLYNIAIGANTTYAISDISNTTTQNLALAAFNTLLLIEQPTNFAMRQATTFLQAMKDAENQASLQASLIVTQANMFKYSSAQDNLRSSAIALLTLFNNMIDDRSRARIISKTVDEVTAETINQLEAMTDPSAVSAVAKRHFETAAQSIASSRRDAEKAREVSPLNTTFINFSRVQSNGAVIEAMLAALKPWEDAIKECHNGTK